MRLGISSRICASEYDTGVSLSSTYNITDRHERKQTFLRRRVKTWGSGAVMRTSSRCEANVAIESDRVSSESFIQKCRDFKDGKAAKRRRDRISRALVSRWESSCKPHTNSAIALESLSYAQTSSLMDGHRARREPNKVDFAGEVAQNVHQPERSFIDLIVGTSRVRNNGNNASRSSHHSKL
jgi:hypothetical protein